jgi:hypothetical protein
MTAQNHIVHREILEVRLEGAVEGWSIQKRMERINEDRILPILDEVFSLVSPSQGHLRIERMVIDLGKLSLRSLDQELPEKLRQGLFKALKPLVERGETGRPVHEEEGNLKGERFETGRLLSMEQSGIEVLRFFLERGLLPWWSDETSMENLLAHLIETVPQEVKTTIWEYAGFEPCRTRLVYQFSDALLLRVFRLVEPENSGRIEGWFHDLNEAGALLPWAIFRTGQWRKVFWGLVFKVSHELGDNGNPDAFQVLKGLAREARMEMRAFLTALDEAMKAAEPALESDLRHRIQTRMAKGDRLFLVSAPDPPASQGGRDGARPAPCRELSPPEAVVSPRVLGAQALEGEAAEIRVENAGLVLLWPFLAELFHPVGYLEETGFAHEETRIRAVHLLEYAGTGKEGRAEPFLALNKVLCGLDVTAPIPLAVDLGLHERRETDKMLGAVISRWAALKSTSVNGLRSAFLVRPGLLSKKEKAWMLQVERRPYDVLLDRLPWGIAMIKLSWMKEMLGVEW